MDERTVLRGSVNKGFRAPQINELYIYPPHNEDLEAEVVWNYEIGLNRRLGAGLTLDMAAYRMEGENLIEATANDAPGPRYLFQNIGAFQMQGFETSLTMEPTRSLLARLSYTHLDPGEKTAGRPGDKVDISARWTSDRFMFSSAGQYVTNYFGADERENRIPDYFVWDARLGYEISTALEAFMAVDNILDNTYAIYANLPGSAAGLYTMPRRRLTAGLMLQLE
jgi:outer membrane receptor protein involved in Fe transport